jgi:2-isopropylmalate synthase
MSDEFLFLQFLSSRPTTPVPFRPKRSNTDTLYISSLAKEMNGAPKSGPDAVARLEATVEKDELARQVNGGAEGANGHAT